MLDTLTVGSYTNYLPSFSSPKKLQWYLIEKYNVLTSQPLVAVKCKYIVT